MMDFQQIDLYHQYYHHHYHHYHHYYYSSKYLQQRSHIQAAEDIWKSIIKVGKKINSQTLKDIKSKLICYRNGEFVLQELYSNRNLMNDMRREHFSIAGDISGSINACFVDGDTFLVEILIRCERSYGQADLPKFDWLDLLFPSWGMSVAVYAEVDELEQSHNIAITLLSNLFPENWKYKM